MKRNIIIFGNHMPFDVLLVKIKEVKKQLNKEGIDEQQTTIYVSDSARCYKTADDVSPRLNGNNFHRTDGIVTSKLYTPFELSQLVQDDEHNFFQIVILVVNYSTEGIVELFKQLGAASCTVELAIRLEIDLTKNVIYFRQEDSSLQMF
jgi:hypothetical protein